VRDPVVKVDEDPDIVDVARPALAKAHAVKVDEMDGTEVAVRATVLFVYEEEGEVETVGFAEVVKATALVAEVLGWAVDEAVEVGMVKGLFVVMGVAGKSMDLFGEEVGFPAARVDDS
jgi:hypothetical protein